MNTKEIIEIERNLQNNVDTMVYDIWEYEDMTVVVNKTY